MKAFVPVIGAKPGSGFFAGAAGNVAFYRGDTATTHISSIVASATVSTQKQVSINESLTMFGRSDRNRLDTDHVLQWTSMDIAGLGASADTTRPIKTDFDFIRLHQTAYLRVRSSLFAGGGVYFDRHTNVGPAKGAETGWADSAYVAYSNAHDLPLDTQTSGGISADLMWDSRDSFIDARRGWLGKVSYQYMPKNFLGSDSAWQKVVLDGRSYLPLDSERRHLLAFWSYNELTTGTVPYFDLPFTAGDPYGRSSRGYREGQFRGEQLVYGEIEYRGSLTRNRLLGMVAFVNTATISNRDSGERLFDAFATAGGAGLRLLVNKRSRTNLCFDVAFGKQSSRGIYLAVQEAF